MNNLMIVGNLTHDPNLQTTQSGIPVCSFTVAVNRRRKADGQPDTDYFRGVVWRALAESCGRYLQKGRKVACSGPARLVVNEKDGKTYAHIELSANEVEFLSSPNGATSDGPGYESGRISR